MSVANGAAQMKYTHTSTKSKAWLAVPTLGSKLNPSVGLPLAVAGCPEPSPAEWVKLRLSSCSIRHSMGTKPIGPGVNGQKVNRISGDSDNKS